MEWDSFDYKIASHYLSALINGDESGLEGSDAADLADFEAAAHNAATRADFTVGHWSADSNDEGEDFGQCAVSGLFAMRASVKLMVYRREPVAPAAVQPQGDGC